MVLQRIEIFWDMMLLCWVSGSQHFEEIMGTTHPATQCHIPKGMCIQVSSCKLMLTDLFYNCQYMVSFYLHVKGFAVTNSGACGNIQLPVVNQLVDV